MPIYKAPLPKTTLSTKADKHLETASANHPNVVALYKIYRVTPQIYPLSAKS
jgi:hypothetical protein